jgi:hypothetical protein
MPVVGRRRIGIAQAVLRLHADLPNKVGELVDAYTHLQRVYPGEVFSVSVTANVILRSSSGTRNSYSVYYGE